MKIEAGLRDTKHLVNFNFSLPEGDEDLIAEEEDDTLIEEDESAMDIGTTYKEDAEQDLDDVIHTPPGKDPNAIPPPEEM